MRNLVLPSLWLVAALVALPPAPVAFAQDAPPAPAFRGLQSVAGYSTTAALSGDWQVVDIYFVPNREVMLPNGRPWLEYAARRVSGAQGEAGVESWASSRDCPSLNNTLAWMTALVAPRIEIPGISPNEADPAGRRPLTVAVDGLGTRVWGRGTQPDHTMNTRVDISSNGGLIAEFGRAATENLASCWRPEQPTF